MDASRFDRLSKLVAGANSRRSLVQAAAALAIAGIPTLQGEGTEAKRRGKRQGVGAEHWNKKKANYCLNGETIRRYRRKQEKLLAMGATLGKCGDTPPPCVPTTCEALGAFCAAPDGCGGTLDCGDCGLEATCCSGQCVFTELDVDNCGECGNVCPGGGDASCVGGVCGPT
jgi:hypothetical protein